MPVESTPHSLLNPSDNGDDGWTSDSMAKLEKELGLVWEEQVKSSSPSALTSLSPRSVEALQGEIQSRPEASRETCRRGTPALGFQEWERQEARVAAEALGRRKLVEEELVGEREGERRH
jgi:hypothetical protein